jgi:tRNA1(Val) A37 N6-methylase TrmN6
VIYLDADQEFRGNSFDEIVQFENVFANPPFCRHYNTNYSGYRYWAKWDREYHFTGLGVINLEAFMERGYYILVLEAYERFRLTKNSFV